MKFGITVRNMGPQSSAALVSHCVQAAEAADLHSVWITDHIAIPADDAEGSNGRYLDPLTTLAWIAGQTEKVKLGTGVLILPYREPLPTAKAVATVQELSGERLLLGVGIGWMAAEFRALSVPLAERVQRSHRTLEFLRRCFAEDEVELNGQRFLFKPRPARPPIYIGGAAPHALERTVAYGDGWLPMGADPQRLAPAIEQLQSLAAKAGRKNPEVIVMGRLRDREQLARLDELGVEAAVASIRYDDADGFDRQLQALVDLIHR